MKLYQCMACSYRGSRFRQGMCPACGSADIRAETAGGEASEKRKPYGLLFCVGLWLYLAVEIYRRYAG